MAYSLEHHGLIEVPLAGRPAGIYWLRFYRGTPRSVALLTEVPGNPSLSVTNAMSRVRPSSPTVSPLTCLNSLSSKSGLVGKKATRV